MAVLGKSTREWDTAALLLALQNAGVLAERVQSYGQWLEDPHVQQRQVVRWQDAGALGVLPLVELPGAEGRRGATVLAPSINQDAEAILRELGLS